MFIISGFLVGLLSVVFCWAIDMRGQEFNPDYFKDDDNVFGSFMIIVMGYLSPIFIIIAAIPFPDKPFTRLIYKLVNIGVKK